jgi:hypothetical protein
VVISLRFALTRGAFELCFGTDVERLNNPSIYRCHYIHSTIQIRFRNTSLPCVRKASFDSRLAVTYHGYG